MKKKKDGGVKKKVLFSSSNSALTNISLCQKLHYKQARFCSGNGLLVMQQRADSSPALVTTVLPVVFNVVINFSRKLNLSFCVRL